MTQIDYEAEYKKLRTWVLKLSPYCDTCANEGEDNICDECHRKSFNWKVDGHTLPKIGVGI